MIAPVTIKGVRVCFYLSDNIRRDSLTGSTTIMIKVVVTI